MRCNCVTYTSSGGESTRAPPVAQSPVLEDLPENGVGDARRALRRRPGAARRRASGRRGGSAEEARNHFGRRCGHGGAAARQQRAESKQLLVVLQNVLLIGTGEAHAIKDFHNLGVSPHQERLSARVCVPRKTSPRNFLKSTSTEKFDVACRNVDAGDIEHAKDAMISQVTHALRWRHPLECLLVGAVIEQYLSTYAETKRVLQRDFAVQRFRRYTAVHARAKTLDYVSLRRVNAASTAKNRLPTTHSYRGRRVRPRAEV